jgi:hypothetical protein
MTKVLMPDRCGSCPVRQPPAHSTEPSIDPHVELACRSRTIRTRRLIEGDRNDVATVTHSGRRRTPCRLLDRDASRGTRSITPTRRCGRRSPASSGSRSPFPGDAGRSDPSFTRSPNARAPAPANSSTGSRPVGSDTQPTADRSRRASNTGRRAASSTGRRAASSTGRRAASSTGRRAASSTGRH